MSSNNKKASSNFTEWEKLTAQLEEKFAAMEILQNWEEHYKTAGGQFLTDQAEKEKKLIPSELARLEKEIPALMEEIAKVENNIKGVDQQPLKKAKEKKAVGKKTEEKRMIDLGKKGIKEPPYASLPPMEEYGYPPGVNPTSGDFGDHTNSTLGGKRRKKKSRRRRTKKKKSRRREKKTRKKRKKRKRRRRTKKN